MLEISTAESIKMNHSSNEKEPETIEPLRYLRYALFLLLLIVFLNVTKLDIQNLLRQVCV